MAISEIIDLFVTKIPAIKKIDQLFFKLKIMDTKYTDNAIHINEKIPADQGKRTLEAVNV